MNFTPAQMKRWQQSPADFIETQLVDPVTNKSFVLLPAERAFIEHAFQVDEKTGRLRYPEMIYATPRKGGKTGFASMMMLTMVLLYGGRFGEGYCVANDLEQAESRVFQALSRIVECSPLLKDVTPTRNRATFPNFGSATIAAIASDAAGAAGHNACFSTFDELWGFTSERSRHLWDEMSTSPVRKISGRLTTTYAGYEGESVLLEELYKRGLAQPKIGKDLYAGDGILMFWTHDPVAPWQTQAWLDEQRRSLRPNQYLRQIENRFVGSESSFVTIDKWDACVDQAATPLISDPDLPIWVGIDASIKHDSTAIVAVTWDQIAQRVRLVSHRVFQPSPDDPLDFEATIEETVLALASRFNLRKAIFDPYQMQSSAQRLANAGIRIEEFPQSSGNLTLASQNLFDLIEGRNLAVYPDDAMRLAVGRCVAIEGSRGWRIAKEKQSHKIDVVIALAQACWAAISMGASADRKRLSWTVIDGQGRVFSTSTKSQYTDDVRSAFGSVVYTGDPADDWHRPRARPPNNTDFLRDGACDKPQR
jgi:phage terminase large subunit-like protein